MKTEYYPGLSIGRGIAAILIVMLHTSPFSFIGGTPNLLLSSVITRWAVPYFFLLSGYLYSQNREVRSNYCKVYIKRLIMIYAFWIVIYSPHKVLYLIKHWPEQSAIDWLIITIRDIFYTGFYQHMWFIPAMALAIILCSLTLRKQKVRYVGVLAGVLYILGALSCLYGKRSFLGKVINHLFVTGRNGLFFGFPLVFLGASVQRFKDGVIRNQKKTWIWLIASIFFNITEVLCADYLHCAVDYSIGFTTFLTPFLALILLSSTKQEAYSPQSITFAKISDSYSMGLFYLHPLVLFIAIPAFGLLGISIETPFLFMFVFLGTVLILYAMKKTLRKTIFRKCV